MRTTLLAILMLALLHGALAYVLTVTMDVYQNDTAFPVYMHLSQKGMPSLFQGKSGLYRLEVLDDSGLVVDSVAYNLSFYVMSDPPTPSDNSPLEATLYVNEQASKLNLYKGSKLLFSYDLPRNQTCRRDGICEAGESYLSCPSDCSVLNDGVCTPVQDSICDPDCPLGVDLDCTGWKRMRPAVPPSYPAFPSPLVLCGGTLALLVLALLIWLIFRRLARVPSKTTRHAGSHPVGHSARPAQSKRTR